MTGRPSWPCTEEVKADSSGLDMEGLLQAYRSLRPRLTVLVGEVEEVDLEEGSCKTSSAPPYPTKLHSCQTDASSGTSSLTHS